MPPDLTLTPGRFQIPSIFLFSATLARNFRAQTSDIAKLLENTALAARLAPSMMGADGPRTYFMAFQTNAEARGTGGLLGGFGVLRFDNGTATVDTLASNRELIGSFAPVDLGPEYAETYGFTNPTTDFRNSNLSSHFPYAAQIWKSMWAQQSGMNVDGVIAIDPVALSYILGAVGPVTMPDGEIISKDNVVELTESTAYIRFPTDQTARKNYLQDIANEVVKKMTGGVESPRKLLDALGEAVSQRRIAVWSSSPADQKLLEQTPLAHVIPDDPAPYAEVVINNLGGNKMDYYLKREIEYAADGCDGETRMSTVTIRLTNTVPDKPLPDYVASSAGLRPEIPIEVPSGTMLTSVRLLATTDAKLVSALANGQRVPAVHQYGTRSPELRSTGSHTARAIRRIELPPFRTDVSGCTTCSDSAVAGHCHSRSIGARVLGMSRTRRKRGMGMLRFRYCLQLSPIRGLCEITNGILPQIATSADGAHGAGQSAVKGRH